MGARSLFMVMRIWMRVCVCWGVGPVSDVGYGVSYMMADDDRTFFHVSSKHSCNATDSKRFMRGIKQALTDLKALFD